MKCESCSFGNDTTNPVRSFAFTQDTSDDWPTEGVINLCADCIPHATRHALTLTEVEGE